jgi:hypothetical protein
MNMPQEESIPMDGDHREICRFNRTDERFEAVWKAVSRLVAIKAPSNSEGTLHFTDSRDCRLFHRFLMNQHLEP